jgi:hypothetical protein
MYIITVYYHCIFSLYIVTTITVHLIQHHLACACHKFVRSIIDDLLTPITTHKCSITKHILHYMLILPLKIVPHLEAQQLQIWFVDIHTRKI